MKINHTCVRGACITEILHLKPLKGFVTLDNPLDTILVISIQTISLVNQNCLLCGLSRTTVFLSGKRCIVL